MGSDNSEMEKQKPICEEVLQKKRDSVTTYYRWGGRCCPRRKSITGARDASFCRTASAETGVAERSATVWIGDRCIEFHEEMSPELTENLMIRNLQSC